MGRHRINRPRRQIGAYIDQELYDKCEYVMQRSEIYTISDLVQRALQAFVERFGTPEMDAALMTRPRPGKLSLAMDDMPITTLVPEHEATEVVDQPVSKDKDQASIQDILGLAQGIKVDK